MYFVKSLRLNYSSTTNFAQSCSLSQVLTLTALPNKFLNLTPYSQSASQGIQPSAQVELMRENKCE
jgi:hypothetical protein